MKPTPILFVDHTAALGGAEHSLLLILRHLDRAKWDIHIAGVPGRLLEEAAQLNLTTHPLPLNRLRRSLRAPLDWWRGIQAVSQVARTINAQIIIANTIRAAFYTAPAGTLTRLPFIWHMRDFWLGETAPRYPNLDLWLKGLLLLQATKVITNSRVVAEHLPLNRKTTIIHNALDTTHFDPTTSGEAFRQAHHIPPTAPLVGMVGRLRPWKGQRTFLEVSAYVSQWLPEAYFAVVGGEVFGVEDGYAQELEKMVEDMGLSGRVTFTGQLNDVRPALAAFDVFVHPGDPEPFGLVNIEAMAMGKPMVAFAHGALPEIVVDKETGLLVPAGDTSAMTQAIIHLLRQPNLRHQLSQSARTHAQTHFHHTRLITELETALHTTLA